MFFISHKKESATVDHVPISWSYNLRNCLIIRADLVVYFNSSQGEGGNQGPSCALGTFVKATRKIYITSGKNVNALFILPPFSISRLLIWFLFYFER
jgi:hypothetical protein